MSILNRRLAAHRFEIEEGDSVENLAAALAHLEAGPHAEAAVRALESWKVDEAEAALVEALARVRHVKMMASAGD
ncbi:MAG: hypothetical protein JSS20_20680 [Proteobacteria bacterium]|nr:hypothetical protein [Pseudomonadota bacterium]